MSNHVPKNWCETTVGEIVEFNYGKSLPKAQRNNHGKIPVYGSNGVVGFHDYAHVDMECIIIGRKGAVGKVHFSNSPCYPIDTTYYIISGNHLNPIFLTYLFRTLQFETLDKSTAIPGLNRNDAYSIPLNLPPLKEQHRIVAEIEELFTKLDAAEEELKNVKKQLERYRQSVLKAAFEGKLTEGGNETWVFKNLGELKKFSIYGPRFSSKDYSNEGVAVLRTSDISESGKVDWANAPKINLSKEQYEKYKLQKSDLLITRTGSIGTISIFNDDVRAIPGAFLIHYRLKPEVLVSYIYYFLKASKAQKHFKEYSSGVGRPNLNVPNIEKLEIPVPSMAEQILIVNKIENYFSKLDKLSEIIYLNEYKLNALKQKILQKAFEGKLVPQDPNDEPASELLKRIKAEKEKLEAENKKKKKVSKKK